MTVSLKALFDETIIHDTTRLPDYQREYVWDGDQQKSLIASFFNATPLGSILLFRGTRGGNSTSFMAKGLGRVDNILPFTPSNEEVDYLLDGQQRVTTLINTFFDLYSGVDPTLLDEMLQVKNYNSYTMYRALHRRWFIDLNGDAEQLFGYDHLDFDPEKIALSSEALELEHSAVLVSKIINKQQNDPPPFHPNASQADLRAYCIENKLIPLFLCGSDEGEVSAILQGIQSSHSNMSLAQNCSWADDLHHFLTQTIIYADEGNDDADTLESYYCLQTERVGIRRLNRAFFTFEKRNHAGEALKPFDLISAKGAVAFYRLGNQADLMNLNNNDFTANLTLKIKHILLNELNLTRDFLQRVNIFNSKNQLTGTFKNYFVQTLSLYCVHQNQGPGSILPVHTKAGWMVSHISSQEIADHFAHITQSIYHAFAFLNEHQKVYNLGELPFTPLFLPIAFLFSVLGDQCRKLESREFLNTWFWGTMFSLEYGKDASTAAAKDCNDLYILLTEKKLSARFQDRINDLQQGTKELFKP